MSCAIAHARAACALRPDYPDFGQDFGEHVQGLVNPEISCTAHQIGCILTVPRSACNNAALATHACCVLSVPRPVSHCTAFIPFLCPSVPSVHGGDVGDCLQGLPYDFAALCPTLA